MTANTTEIATAAHAELIYLNPAEAEIEPNTRDTVDPVKLAELTESIREHGVLQAIKAVRYADGTIRVRDGQCRTLAARDAGLTSLPALVTPDTATSDTERGIERITQQIVANDHRNDLTDGQRAAGIAQMLDLGASVTKIAKAVHLPRAQVKAAAAVGTSATARTALDSGQLDLEQAEIVARFETEGDAEAVDKLMTAGRYQFRYIAQRLLDDRAEKAERAAAAQPYLDRGYTILAEEPRYGTDVLLADLVADDGGEVTAAHTEADPARWAVWLSKDERYFDTESGEEVDGEEVDWSTENHPDATPYEGHRHANTVQTRQVWTPEYVCLDLDGAAVALSPVLAAARTATEGEGTEDDAAAALRMEAESRERQRAERRQVRELNKQAAAATTVRRDFLRTTLLARKTAPKGTATFIAATLAADSGLLSEYNASTLVPELLGFTDFNIGGGVLTLLDTATDNRAQVITLALVAAALEARMVNDAWRSRPRSADRYLTFLTEHGHTLTPVEEVIAGQRTPDDVEID
ncbi:ParB/RepB/Spo0J family partition protein [Rhodococcus koreensis]|uniref:ParB/RepB/Spo0J family partition protein n=1 Tax=Rhodococcus koreensis TaxID=99653 RepID=UPI0036DA0C5F